MFGPIVSNGLGTLHMYNKCCQSTAPSMFFSLMIFWVSSANMLSNFHQPANTGPPGTGDLCPSPAITRSKHYRSYSTPTRATCPANEQLAPRNVPKQNVSFKYMTYLPTSAISTAPMAIFDQRNPEPVPIIPCACASFSMLQLSSGTASSWIFFSIMVKFRVSNSWMVWFKSAGKIMNTNTIFGKLMGTNVKTKSQLQQ